jgi:hypothetical protein
MIRQYYVINRLSRLVPRIQNEEKYRLTEKEKEKSGCNRRTIIPKWVKIDFLMEVARNLL